MSQILVSKYLIEALLNDYCKVIAQIEGTEPQQIRQRVINAATDLYKIDFPTPSSDGHQTIEAD